MTIVFVEQPPLIFLQQCLFYFYFLSLFDYTFDLLGGGGGGVSRPSNSRGIFYFSASFSAFKRQATRAGEDEGRAASLVSIATLLVAFLAVCPPSSPTLPTLSTRKCTKKEQIKKQKSQCLGFYPFREVSIRPHSTPVRSLFLVLDAALTSCPNPNLYLWLLFTLLCFFLPHFLF